MVVQAPVGLYSLLQQITCWKRGMLPKCLLSIKGRTCNQTLLHQSSTSIPLVLFEIWPGQATLMKNKWLWGDNSVNIQGMIMVIVHCSSSY